MEAGQDASDFLADSADEISQDETNSTDPVNQRQESKPNVKPGEEIADYWDQLPGGFRATKSFAETVDRARSGSDKIFDGLTGRMGKPRSAPTSPARPAADRSCPRRTENWPRSPARTAPATIQIPSPPCSPGRHLDLRYVPAVLVARTRSS